jgi:hypothetical protein
MNKRSREERTRIEPTEGLHSLIDATLHASTMHLGSRGTPSIIAMRDLAIYHPGENQCRMAADLVLLSSGGFIRKEFCDEKLGELIYENVDHEQINDEMRKEALGDPDLFLRGFK